MDTMPLFILCGAEDWIQGLTHARWALYHWATTLTPEFFYFFFEREREREREFFNIYFLVFGGHNIFVCGATRAARMPGESDTAWATSPAQLVLFNS